MTTWLPAICVLIVAIIFTIFITDPMFRGNDKKLGGILGLVFGIIVAAVFYGVVGGVMLIL